MITKEFVSNEILAFLETDGYRFQIRLMLKSSDSLLTPVVPPRLFPTRLNCASIYCIVSRGTMFRRNLKVKEVLNKLILSASVPAVLISGINIRM